MLKVLYLPIGSQPGTERGFRNIGCDLKVYDFFTESQHKSSNIVCSEFLNVVKAHKPDLIHMQLQMTNVISVDTVKKAREIVPGVIITNWTGDIRKAPDRSFLQMSQCVDASLLSHVGQINLYKSHGCKNPLYWQIGYDPKNHYPKYNTKFKYVTSFAGNAYGGNLFPDSKLRMNICTTLKSKYANKFGLFGSGYGSMGNGEIPISLINDIYNDSACVLSISHFNDVSHYFSDRLVMCLASGRPTIIYRFPGYESYFCKNRDVLVAENPTEVPQLVQYCINNPDIANKIGLNGFRKVNAEHSFTSRVLELVNMLGLADKI
jgi:hypothetical protein